MPKLNQKGFSPALLLIVVVLIAGVAFVAGTKFENYSNKITNVRNQPNTSGAKDESLPSASVGEVWTTYTNKKLGFTLKHPRDFIEIESSLPISTNYPNPVPIVTIDSPNLSINIALAPAPANLSIHNALGDGPSLRYTYDLLNNKNTAKIQVDGVEGIRADAVAAGQSGSITDIIVFKDKKIYQITFTPVTTENTELFNKILATFKFSSD